MTLPIPPKPAKRITYATTDMSATERNSNSGDAYAAFEADEPIVRIARRSNGPRSSGMGTWTARAARF